MLKLRNFLWFILLLCLAPQVFAQVVSGSLTAHAAACGVPSGATPHGTTGYFYTQINTNQGAAVITASGTWSGTVSFFKSGDGATWAAISSTDATPISSTTGNGNWQFNVAGQTHICAAFTTATSGTVNVSISVGQQSARVGGGGGSGSGTVTSIATTAPLTGGTITATGTIACPTCEVTANLTCDGMTDIHTALQEAVTAAANGQLDLPAGTCVTSVAISVANPIKITGRGKYNTIVQLATASNTDVFDVTSGSVTFADLSIDGNAANQSAGTHYGIYYATTLSGLTLDHVLVKNSIYYGVFMISDSHVLIQFCDFGGSLNSQYLYNTTASVASTDIKIAHNTFDSTGALIGSTPTAPFVDLFFGAAIGASSSVTQVSIDDNTILFPITPMTETDGLVIDSASGANNFNNVTISHNRIVSPAGTWGGTGTDAAIELVGVNNETVTGNVLIDSYNGIFQGGISPTNITITGNSITGNATTGSTSIGIDIDATSGTGTNVNVSGNTVAGWESGIQNNTIHNAVISTNNISVPNVTTCTGIELVKGESVNVDKNVIVSACGSDYAISQAGATEKYESYHGNTINGSGYGIVFNGTTYTRVVIEGTVFDGISSANYYSGIPGAGVTILDDNQITANTLTYIGSGGIAATSFASGGFSPVSLGASTQVYNTAAITQTASISATTMLANPAADRNYRFSVYIGQLNIGTTCTTPGSVAVSIIYTDAITGVAYTYIVPLDSSNDTSLLASVPLASASITVANVGSGITQLRAKASTNIQYSTTYASGSCVAGQAYNIYPVLEAE